MLHGKLVNKPGHFSLIKEFSLAPFDSLLLIFHKIFATNTEPPVLNCLHKDFFKNLIVYMYTCGGFISIFGKTNTIM